MIKKKVKKPKRIQAQIEMGPGRIRKRRVRQYPEPGEERSMSRKMGRKPPKAGLKINRGVITDEMMTNLETELTKLWEDSNTPKYHIDVFQQYLKPLQREAGAAMMAKEIDDLK